VVAPAPATVSVLATSVADPTKSASANVNVVPVVAVSVTPTNVSVAAGSTEQFSASVTGTPNTAVTWTVSGTGCSGTACGTINSAGLYSAPTTVPSPATVMVTATSAADSTKSESAGATIQPIPAATYYLAPASAGGNDSNSGTSPASPWLTPNHAVNCGDVIIAAASTGYQYSNFTTGDWGVVSCPARNNVAWLTCATFDACKITSSGPTNYQGFWVDQSFWGVQSWEVDMPPTDGYGTCFNIHPNAATPVEISHIIFADDICDGASQGGFGVSNQGDVGADYIVVVGNIAYNAAQGTISCTSGIDFYEPVQSDSLPGTHIYVGGNFSFGNLNPRACNNGQSTDGEGILFDTFDGSQADLPSPYSAQAVAENNILVANGGRGIEVFNNSAGSSHASIYLRHNTTWGNSLSPILYTAGDGCGEIEISSASDVQAYDNLVSTNNNDPTGCDSEPLYAFFMFSGNSTNSVHDNFGYSAAGNNTFSYGSGTFAFGPNNIFGANPSFANAVAPGAPSCGSFSSVPACMATVIANFAPTNAAASSYGYQIPSTASVYDPLFPQWLCNVNLPVGLVTMGCSTAP
jgi:hypothetical protein